jgi:hypothetical protein
MREISDEVQKGKLYFSLLAKDEIVLAEARAYLARQFSHLDFETPVMESQDGQNYLDEMGASILRQWVSCHNLIFVPQLVEIKRTTYQAEVAHTVDGRRTINIDPGYITDNKAVRATRRDAPHRLYINRGIYVESILIVSDDGNLKPWDWTDADFRSPVAHDFFHNVRLAYIKQQLDSEGDLP